MLLFEFLFSPECIRNGQTKNRSYLKTWESHKKSIVRKWLSDIFQYSLQILPILENFSLRILLGPFGRYLLKNAIWFFSTLRIFYVKMTTSEGVGGVCISQVGTQPIDHISRTKNRTKKIIVRSIRLFPVNLANVEENLIFCVSFWTIRTPIPNSKTEKSWDMIFLSFQP